MNDKREELIEEAAKAIRLAHAEEMYTGMAFEGAAEAAFAVFERAHTPTDGERESDGLCGDWPAPCNCDDPDTHDGSVPRWLVESERRPVQAEPTDAQVDAFKREWWAAKDEGDDGNKVRRGLRAAYEEGKKR